MIASKGNSAVIDDLGFDDVLERLEENASRLRLNAEWSTAIALRDMMGIAGKGARNKNATYQQAFVMGQILIPELFDEHSVLNRQKLSETARKYIQIAEAKSEEGKAVLPEDLLKQEIALYEGYVQKETPMQDMSLIRKELQDLQNALRELQKKKATENSLIFSDAYQVRRNLPVSGIGRNYREFKISDNRALRVTVLHPDKPEYASGADLIYENYWEKDTLKLVRVAALQYKMWKNRSLYIDERMEKQLEKLKHTFCANGFCNAGENTKRKEAYRLPYCAAFLRPSDELQSEDASLLSTGYYVPICVVKRLQQTTVKGNGILQSKYVRSEAITHKIFEEMFNSNMLGSRWLTYNELEQLYQVSGILHIGEHIPHIPQKG